MGLEGRYLEALLQYVDGSGDAAGAACQIGSQASASGYSLGGLTTVHHHAVARVLAEREAGAAALLEACSDFLLHVVAGFEQRSCEHRDARALLQQVNEAVEQQTRRLAHVLHDEAGQLLTLVHLKLADATRQVPPRCRTCFGEVGSLLTRIEEQLRRISHEFHPTILEDLGFQAAIEFLAAGITGRTGIRIDVQCAFKQRLRPEIEVALYRVVQEALTNAAKHSAATLVTVAMVRERSVVRCEIRDDGGGFDVAAISAPSGKRGLGLLGMRERVAAVAGSLQFDSAPGQGTRILVSVPVPDCARPSEAG